MKRPSQKNDIYYSESHKITETPLDIFLISRKCIGSIEAPK